jgi:hypothetical protein
MRSLATQYGFRTNDTAGFNKFIADHNVTVPTTILDVIEPPTFETLEAMISRLEALYQGQGLPSPVPDPTPSALDSISPPALSPSS